MDFGDVAWLLWIPALIIGWYVYNAGPTISNIFYGLGSFTAIVTILYVLTGEDIPSGVKVVILFLIAFVAIGMGYYIGKGNSGEEGTEEKVNEEKVVEKEKVETEGKVE